jgi:dienelactone hydrolase
VEGGHVGKRVEMTRHLAIVLRVCVAAVVATAAVSTPSRGSQNALASERQSLMIESTIDHSLQKSFVSIPPHPPEGSRPLLVVLHSWGSDNEGSYPPIEGEAASRGWFVLAPNFRGPSDHPNGCGSLAAQQDIIDAVAYARSHFPVDPTRIYLMGYSGGGYMTLLMASRYAQHWAAASAWAGIADLADWYRETANDDIRRQLRGCFGDAPDGSGKRAEYLARSPITYLRPSLDVPIEIWHGAQDPQVSVRHAFRAFELLAPGAVSIGEADQIVRGKPDTKGEGNDPLVNAKILFRRTEGSFRLTIYEGGHDYFPRAGIAWLAEHYRP